MDNVNAPAAQREASLRPAGQRDIEAICEFLAANMGRGLAAADYLALFTYPWRPSDASLGVVLESCGRIVGFIGCVWADRMIQGEIHRFCNLSNWCVLPEFRRQSMDMFFAVVCDRNITYTDLSPIPAVENLLTGMRFCPVNHYKWFTVPMMHAVGLLRKVRIVTDRDTVLRYLDPSQAAIWRDHQGIGCQHTVLVDDSGYCYVVSRKRKRKQLVFSEILYVSDAPMMRRHLERLKISLLARDRTLVLACDEHIYGARPWGFVRYFRPEYLRSRFICPKDIDHLYSETALL